MKSAPFLLVVLVCAAVASTEPVVHSDDPPPREDPKDVAAPMLEPYYVMANWFLGDLVQMSYLYDLEDTIGLEFTSFDQLWESAENYWEEWTEYFIGFAICASFGVLLIIGMPIAGCIVACCRCCGNCGSETPSNVSASNCRRYGCGIALLIVTAAVAFGAAGIFIVNEEMKEQLVGTGGEGNTMGDSNLFADLTMSVDILDNYIDSTLDELNTTVLEGYVEATGELFQTLENIPEDSLMALDNATGVMDNLAQLTNFTLGLPATQIMMEEAQNLTETLNQTLTELEGALGTLTPLIIADLNNSNCNSEDCINVEEKLNNLSVNISTNGINFATAIAAINTALNGGIIQSVNDSIQSLQSVVDDIDAKIEPEINATKFLVQEAEKEITKFLNDLEKDLAQIDFESAADSLKDAEEVTEKLYPFIYWPVLTLGILVCITLLCNVVGVSLGMLCPRPVPGESGACSSDSARGSDWLLAGLTLTFVFYWMYVVIVLAVFLGGGVAETEFCRHAVNYENPDSVRVLEIFDRMLNSTLYESSGVELEPFSVYSECADNASFYQALSLAQRGYNISEIIDLSAVEESISDLKNINIDPIQVNVMTAELERVLDTLETGLQSLDFDAYYSQLSGDVVTEDLNEIADMLDKIDEDEGIDLKNYTNTLRDLSISHVQPAEEQRNELVQLLHQIETATNLNLTGIAANLNSAEATINATGDVILQGFINATSDEIYADVVAFSATLEQAVTEDIGRCAPFYDSLTLAIDSVCIKTLYGVNSLWYALGWVIFWLFPSIILSFCLVQEFRIAGLSKYKSGSDPHAFPIDAYLDPSTHMHVLIPPPMPHNNNLAAEFENPLYDNGDEFKIPRPSLRGESGAGAGSGAEGGTGSEFKIPRPQVYGEAGNSSPPSYRSTEDGDSAVVNPASLDTQL